MNVHHEQGGNIKSETVAHKAMSGAVGDFIRYWGFRRIHGQIWTQVYLSSEALSGVEIARRLNVSKALVSSAIPALLKYGLIERTKSDGRTKRYTANPDVHRVIRGILKQREQHLIQNAADRFTELLRVSENTKSKIESRRMLTLGEMISSAQFAMKFVFETADGK